MANSRSDMRSAFGLLVEVATLASMTGCAARPAPFTLTEWDCADQGSGALLWRARESELLVARQISRQSKLIELVRFSDAGRLLSRRELHVAAEPMAFLNDDHLFVADEQLSLVTSTGEFVASWPLARQPAPVAIRLLLSRRGSFFAELETSDCSTLAVDGCRANASNWLAASATGQLTVAHYGIQPPLSWNLLQRGIAAREQTLLPVNADAITDSTSGADGSVVVLGSYEQGLALPGFATPAKPMRAFFVAKWNGNGSPDWFREVALPPTTKARVQRVSLSSSGDVLVTGSLERGQLSTANRQLFHEDGGGFAWRLDPQGKERSLIGLQLGPHTLAEPLDADGERLLVRQELSDPSGYCRTRVESYAW